jgi:hypothetical protein
MTGDGAPDRFVLEGVPKIEFWKGERCPEDLVFPSAMRACLEYLGEDYGCRHLPGYDAAWRLGCPYAFMVGVTGCAFFLSWRPGWHGDNVALHYMSDDPAAPYRRAFEAVGRDCEILPGSEATEALYRERIIESLVTRRHPALAFGVVGPPEVSLITGYDGGGDVLIGWSFFQDFPEFNAGVEFEPNGCFRKGNWAPETQGLITIGQAREKPPLAEVYRDALRWGLQVLRTPVTYGDRRVGLAAYTAWADQLLCDDDLPADDLPVLRERFGAHDDAVATVAEARWYGALFLTHAAQQLAGIQWSRRLFAAAACLAEEHDLMWEVWALAGGIGRSEEHALEFAKPDARRRMAPIILRARAKLEEAAEHIEQALAAG